MVPLRRPRPLGPTRSAARFAVAGALTAAVLAAPADADDVRPATAAIPAQARDPAVAGPGTAVRDLLDRRAAALLRRDRKAFLETVDPASGTYRRTQAALFDALGHVPLASWSYAFDPARAAPVPAGPAGRDGAPTYVPGAVLLSYRLRGYDPGPVSLPTYPISCSGRAAGTSALTALRTGTASERLPSCGTWVAWWR